MIMPLPLGERVQLLFLPKSQKFFSFSVFFFWEEKRRIGKYLKYLKNTPKNFKAIQNLPQKFADISKIFLKIKFLNVF
jgi:hypothetical protein